jgi:hypothetical protein
LAPFNHCERLLLVAALLVIFNCGKTAKNGISGVSYAQSKLIALTRLLLGLTELSVAV